MQANNEAYWEDPESRVLELKVEFPKGNQIAKTAIAFANGAGGRIVFGIDDKSREVVGIPESELFALEERVVAHISDLCKPPILPEVYTERVRDQTLLVIEIYRGSEKPYHLKRQGKVQGTYVRIGSSTRQAAPETAQALDLQTRFQSFDASPVYELAESDLPLEHFKSTFKQATGRNLDQDGLRLLGLLHEERGECFPTRAAILLSESLARRRLFPYAKIECARFKGVTPEVFLDQRTIDGAIFEATDECLAFVKRNIALGGIIGEVYRTDRWEYPLEAVREALVNAIVHRDYSILGSDIKLAIFDDQLEITSPGSLPGGMPFDRLGTGRSEIRNRILAPVFKELGLIEAWGTGIRKIRTELENWPEHELELKDDGHSFQVIFRKLVPPEPKYETSYTKDTALSPISEIAEELAPYNVTTTTEAPQWQRISCLVRFNRDEALLILGMCQQPEKVEALMEEFGWTNRTKFRHKFIRPLMALELLAMTVPDKPRSSQQRYVTTPAGLASLKAW